MKNRYAYLVAALCVSLFYSFSPLKADSPSTFTNLYCPSDVWISCGAEIWNLDAYGHATLETYSGNTPVYASNSSYHIDDCGNGYIHRTFSTHDPYGGYHSCTQTIWVEPNYTGSHIYWPYDLDLVGCNPDTDPGALDKYYSYPYINESGCSNIGVSYEDQVFDFGAGCTKIVREWTVIDWCQYKPNSPYSQGIYTHTQTIKISNIKEPDIIFPKDITVSADNCKDAFVHLEDIVVDYAACGGDVEVSHNSTYAIDYYSENATGVYPIGTSSVRYTVTYGCGLEESHTLYITVLDDKAPQAYCYGSLAVALMPMYASGAAYPEGGMVEIWASDFDKDSFSPCGHEPLSFSFSSDPNDSFKTFTCDEIGVNQLYMWVTDSKGNQSSCYVELDVQNNNAQIPNCGTGTEAFAKFDVSGSVTMFHDKRSLSDIEVALTGYDMIASVEEVFDTAYVEAPVDSIRQFDGTYEYIMGEVMRVTSSYKTTYEDTYEMVMTQRKGTYGFEGLSQGGHYMLEANMTSEKHQVIPTDILKLGNHLNGQDVQESPYFLLAADVDDSGTVDAKDLEILESIYAGSLSEIPSQTNWLFIDESYQFSDPLNPWNEDFRTYNEMTDMQGITVYDVDFIAIQKGNLSNLEDGIVVGGRSNSNSTISVFPNPFQDYVNVEIVYEDEVSSGLLSVYQINGQLIQQNRIDVVKGSQSISLDTKSYSPGIYLYEIQIGENIFTGKLVK